MQTPATGQDDLEAGRYVRFVVQEADSGVGQGNGGQAASGRSGLLTRRKEPTACCSLQPMTKPRLCGPLDLLSDAVRR